MIGLKKGYFSLIQDILSRERGSQMQFEWDEEKNTINKRNRKTSTIEPGQRLTEEQLKEVEEAMRSPIVFDEDREELSPAMMKAFKSAVIQRNRRKKA